LHRPVQDIKPFTTGKAICVCEMLEEEKCERQDITLNSLLLRLRVAIRADCGSISDLLWWLRAGPTMQNTSLLGVSCGFHL
jgi:hypothetical protein